MADKGRWANVGAVLAVFAVLLFLSGVFCGPAGAQEQWLGYRSTRSAWKHIGSTAGQKLCPQDKAPDGVAMPAFNDKEPLFALWKVDIGKLTGTASANWLKEHKIPFAVGRLPADELAARRVLTAWGVTALPHIVVTDASHTVEAEAVAADALAAVLQDSAGAIQPAPVATRPAFDPLAGLDEAIRQYKKGLDPVEQERLKKMDDSWKQDLKRGWKPPWSHLAANLTDQEIESLSTAELGRRLFDNGLPARTLMLYNSTNAGIKRLEVLYKGYKELFHRSDCWKGLIASLDYYAAQLAVSGKATDNVNAITGLMTVPKFYSYPAIRVNITGHEREIIAAHVRALRRISAYLNASAASTGKGQHEAFFAPMAPSALINWALALGQGLSEQQYQAARAALANPKWAKGIPASEVRAYIDEAAIMLEKFTGIPPATQPATKTPGK